MRKNLRRGMRQLIDAGGEFDLVSRRDAVRPAVRDLFALHADRFQTKNATTGFVAELREPFHAQVAERFFDTDTLRIFRLSVRGRLAATLVLLRTLRRLVLFSGGNGSSVREAERRNAAGGPCDQVPRSTDGSACSISCAARNRYKFRWTQQTRRIMAVRLGVSRRGRAALLLRRQFLALKQLAKRLIRRDPVPDSSRALSVP